MRFNKITNKKLFDVLAYCCAWLLIGVGVLQNQIGIFAIGSVLLFIMTKNVIKFGFFNQFWLFTLGNTVFMLMATLWFRNITPSGWMHAIGPFTPSDWLMIFLVFVLLIISSGVALLFMLYVYIFKRWQIQFFSIAGVLLFCLFLTLAELARAYLFSFLTHSNGVPIRPYWGIFSIASLANNVPWLELAQRFGFWGSSFILYFFTGVGVVSLWHFYRKQYSYFGLLIVLVGFLLLSTGDQNNNLLSNHPILKAIAVSQTNNKDYVPNLVAVLSKESSPSRVVILPEYDNFIKPNGFDIDNLLNPERKKSFESLNFKNTYYAGTQNNYTGNKIYVESFLLNGSKQTVKTRQKKFLIPGGEYSFDWANKIFSLFNKEAVQTFAKTKGHYVVKDSEISTATSKDNISSLVANYPCSYVIAPYTVQQDIKGGAQLITYNISLSQFSNAPEYERFVKRFMTFIANAYQRPVAAGVQDGQALFISPYDNNGLIQQDIITAEIPFNAHKTLYTRLGDLNILLIFTTITTATLLYPVLKQKIKKRILQNRR